MLNAEPILIVCPEEPIQGRVAESLRNCGLRSLFCKDSKQASTVLEGQKFEVVVCGESFAEGELRGLIKAVQLAPVVIISECSEWNSYLVALRAGAFDYVACLSDGAGLKSTLWCALIENARARRGATSAAGTHN